MKKFFLLVFALSAFTMHAQLKVGPNGGVPVGDLSDFYNFSAGADLYYMFWNHDALLDFGGTVGFMNYFGDDINIAGSTVEVDDLQLIPLAGVARITLLGILRFGPDIGYAFILDSDDDASSGEFYWRAVAGIDVLDAIELNAFYSSISSEQSLGTIGVGVLFEF